MTKPLCIYHGNCADGFTAAWAVWKALGDGCEYFPGVYQNEPPDVTGRDVIMVDFSYKRQVLEAMCRPRGARSMLILDHHKTAEADLKGLGVDLAKWTGVVDWKRYQENCFLEEMENANVSGAIVYQIFDMNRSGAGIAWDFFHPHSERHPLVNYVEDRDLWKFALPGSRNINAFIFSYPYEFPLWDEMARFIVHAQPEAERAGSAIERKHHKDVRELVNSQWRPMVIGGQRVPVLNVPYTLTSDAGNLMCGGLDESLAGVFIPPFAACYWDTREGRVFSLRSVGDFDVGEIAKQYGGGGHKNAAGFRVPFTHALCR